MDITASKQKWIEILDEQAKLIEQVRADLKKGDYEEAVLHSLEQHPLVEKVDEAINDVRVAIATEVEKALQSQLGKKYEIRFNPKRIDVFYDGDAMGMLNIETRTYAFYDFCIHEEAFESGLQVLTDNYVDQHTERGVTTVSAIRSIVANRASSLSLKKLSNIRGIREQFAHSSQDSTLISSEAQRNFADERRMTVTRVNTLLHEKYKAIECFKSIDFNVEPANLERKIYVRLVDKVV